MIILHVHLLYIFKQCFIFLHSTLILSLYVAVISALSIWRTVNMYWHFSNCLAKNQQTGYWSRLAGRIGKVWHLPSAYKQRPSLYKMSSYFSIFRTSRYRPLHDTYTHTHIYMCIYYLLLPLRKVFSITLSKPNLSAADGRRLVSQWLMSWSGNRKSATMVLNLHPLLAITDFMRHLSVVGG